MIHRAEHGGDFSQIDNALLRDTSLTDGARSLLFFMLSMSDEWNFSLKSLTFLLGWPAKKVERLVKELKGKGYITQSQQLDERGKFLPVSWDVYEVPHAPPVSRSPSLTETVTHGDRHSRSPSPTVTVKRETFKNINIKEHQDKKNIKGEEERSARGEFKNVFLTSSEFDDLVRDYGAEKVNKYIEDLGDYLKTHPKKKYASHKRTIINWIERDEKRAAFPCQPKEQTEELDWDEMARELEEKLKREGKAI